MTNEARTAEAPEILNAEPLPKPEIKAFHRRKLLGWSGKVRVDRIHGWVGNRRIDLFVRDFEQKYGRAPTNDDIYEHMRSEEKDYKLRALAKDIALNGVHQPIILAADGTLLDGNRRYFSTRYGIENRMGPREELENIPAWVLTPDASDAEKELVIVETNFLPSLKVAWPEYIKALVMYEEWESGVDFRDIAERFGIEKTRVRSMVKAMELVEEFINHHHCEEDASTAERAQIVAYRHFTLFEEAHNKLRSQLDTDVEFKEHFFQWMLDEKFRGITEIRCLGEIRNDEEAWEAIRQDSPDAVKVAIHIVDDKKLPEAQGGERKVGKVIKILRDLKEWEIASISRETMLQLRQVLSDVTLMATAVNMQRMGTPDAVSTREITTRGEDQ